jgi:hypothetical protein
VSVRLPTRRAGDYLTISDGAAKQPNISIGN